MNARTAGKISKQARMLKKNNITAPLKETVAGAGRIARDMPSGDASIGKLMKIALKELKKQAKEDDQVIIEIKNELSLLKAKKAIDSGRHFAEKRKFSKVKAKSGRLKECVDDIETVKGIAEEFQK